MYNKFLNCRQSNEWKYFMFLRCLTDLRCPCPFSLGNPNTWMRWSWSWSSRGRSGKRRSRKRQKTNKKTTTTTTTKIKWESAHIGCDCVRFAKHVHPLRWQAFVPLCIHAVSANCLRVRKPSGYSGTQELCYSVFLSLSFPLSLSHSAGTASCFVNGKKT